VYIKRLELSNFKSFGGTTQIPLLPGFTVVSGPNGSGKSNILDALLFALGLSSSKGMRAERLPDLVNHQQISKSRSTVEASVSVTFELDALPPRETTDEIETTELAQNETNGHPDLLPETASVTEWTVTRKLRVTAQGTYTSTYAINGEPCTLNELHEQLQTLRVYPEGYNVVLQGDVTGIISMPPRERRQIIDELAGVAAFDRKIDQAKEKLDTVKERQDSCHIVEQELIEQRDRLAKDRIQAQKYQQLRAELQTKSQWEAVILYGQALTQVEQLQQQMIGDEAAQTQLTTQLATNTEQIQSATVTLEQLSNRVRALGEDEYLGLQSTLAAQEAELRQLQNQQATLTQTQQQTDAILAQTQAELHELEHTITHLAQERQALQSTELASAQAERNQAQQTLESTREAASEIASQAEAWVQQQTTLHQQIVRLQQTLEPQRTEQAQLQERLHQLQHQHDEQQQPLEPLVATKQQQLAETMQTLERSQEQTVTAAQALATAEEDLTIHQQTQTRLVQEQRDKQRQLDKLEAQTQALQESQGTHATKLILQAGIPGVCGLVAQLGRVDPQFQLALEIAAGARLGHLVVEDDGVAAAGIELLKQRRAGRATFLPLTKIQAPKPLTLPAWQRLDGMIDLALNLIETEPKYERIFAYVLGNTIVFDALSNARRYLGQFRMVTLEGELLEPTGAMSGGSSSASSPLRFGTVAETESIELQTLKTRLRELEDILCRCEQTIQRTSADVKQRSQQLIETRQQHREQSLQVERLQAELQQLQTQQQQLQAQRVQNVQAQATTQARLQELQIQRPVQEAQLAALQQSLAELEQSQSHSQWQQAQANIRVLEAQLNGWELVVRNTEQKLQELDSQRQLTHDKRQQAQQRIMTLQAQQVTHVQSGVAFAEQGTALMAKITETQAAIATLEQTLGETKQLRDQADKHLREVQQSQQQTQWRLEKLQEQQTTRREQLTQLQQQLEAQKRELPEPLPDVPDDVNVEQLQNEVRSLQKRIQAMEPVNMMALEDYERTQARLQDLTDKLTTLEVERTELLLRIENFTTLRQQAFREAFDAVNENFQSIFAILSDGDGYLQLDDPHDPFGSGLNLVAHPKGKPVQRLASMSGGEKSLTALSFIFALQRYRPSPFYAFDEVDMFLDGANVERLAKMIKQQALQAQFIVVSLRRPMIESSQRTIGVTQARGTHTQVLGLTMQPQGASA
jgi:chromosome segregation protein